MFKLRYVLSDNMLFDNIMLSQNLLSDKILYNNMIFSEKCLAAISIKTDYLFW
jgi:hypothetical protein